MTDPSLQNPGMASYQSVYFLQGHTFSIAG